MHKVVSCISGRCAALTGRSSCLTSLARFHLRSGAAHQKSAIKYYMVDIPEMPPCSFKPEEYKGMSKEQMMEIRKQNCNPMTMKITYYKKPVFIHQGYMQWLWDVDGKRYLDLFAGVATVSVGHCHPKVTAATQRQLKKLWHTTNIYIHPELHEYCDKLASYLPDPLKVIYLTNSGSEANELAMLMARLHTGNFDIITFRGSYHGGSQQTMGLTANSSCKFPIATSSGCIHVRIKGSGAATDRQQTHLQSCPEGRKDRRMEGRMDRWIQFKWEGVGGCSLLIDISNAAPKAPPNTELAFF